VVDPPPIAPPPIQREPDPVDMLRNRESQQAENLPRVTIETPAPPHDDFDFELPGKMSPPPFTEDRVAAVAPTQPAPRTLNVAPPRQQAPAPPPSPAPVRPVAPPAPPPVAPAPPPAPIQQAPPTRAHQNFWVQAGAFSTQVRAEDVRETLAGRGITSIIENRDINGQNFFRVRIGPYTSQNEADYWLALIKSINGFEDSQIWQTRSER
jgi:cell division protein FtsN